ncbi:MAG: hypothetical protein K1X83_01790 [Oligoflexia bacterium]|nr:hypothetical protein [Oligoflexia bacterium]
MEPEIVVCGQGSEQIAESCRQELQQLLNAGKLSESEIGRVAKLDFSMRGRELRLDDASLDKLRRLCQLWDVDIRVRQISSHRPLIGPLIVAVKRVLHPLLRALLKDALSQQRDFNAVTIALMYDLLAPKKPTD